MKARALLGQLLIMGFDGTTPSNMLLGFVRAIQPGGVILFKRNIIDPGQTWDLLRACQEAVSTPMFLCVDMEGGTVDRLAEAVAPSPSAAHVFATKNKRLFREHGRLIGEEVRTLGFNTDFAPSVDLAFAACTPVMGTRVVSSNPQQVLGYAREFLRGMRQARVLGCGKHFPGLGEADLDTHNQLAVINKPWERLWAEDLVPYRELGREIPFVMVAHATYPAVTKKALPASISKEWITDILRVKIGYQGLILSDDLEMGGVRAAAPIEQAAIETIRAGADIFLVCHNEDYVSRSYEAVVRKSERDGRFARQVQNAAQRVMLFKKKSAELKQMAQRPTQKAVTRLRVRINQFAERVHNATVVC